MQEYVNSFETARNVTIDLALELLELGVNVGFDCYGNFTPTLPDDDDMNKALLELVRRGYAKHITVGHDITDKTRGVTYGGTGFTGILKSIPPVLKENGYEEAVDQIFVKNPARILAYEAAS